MKMSKLINILVGALALVSVGSVFAHDGYLTDTRGVIVRNNYGECWRTGSWTPAMAIPECGGEVKSEVKGKDTGPDRAFAPVTLQADTLFDFDKADLRPAGKQSLDEFVTNMNTHPEVDLLLVTGHTDQIGTDKYNQKLSERRAASVKAYLVSKGVAADRIETVGMGEKAPVKSVAECKGNRGKKLIECLQPNRRVVVEIKMQKQLKK
jgi:Outer membrane protein and related peptidoglycan-associated (lipo)proteins